MSNYYGDADAVELSIRLDFAERRCEEAETLAKELRGSVAALVDETSDLSARCATLKTVQDALLADKLAAEAALDSVRAEKADLSGENASLRARAKDVSRATAASGTADVLLALGFTSGGGVALPQAHAHAHAHAHGSSDPESYTRLEARLASAREVVVRLIVLARRAGLLNGSPTEIWAALFGVNNYSLSSSSSGAGGGSATSDALVSALFGALSFPAPNKGGKDPNHTGDQDQQQKTRAVPSSAQYHNHNDSGDCGAVADDHSNSNSPVLAKSGEEGGALRLRMINSPAQVDDESDESDSSDKAAAATGFGNWLFNLLVGDVASEAESELLVQEAATRTRLAYETRMAERESQRVAIINEAELTPGFHHDNAADSVSKVARFLTP